MNCQSWICCPCLLNDFFALYLCNSISLKHLMQTYLYLFKLYYCFSCLCVYKERSVLCDCRKRVHLNSVCSLITFPYQMKGCMDPVTHYLSNIKLKQWYLTNPDQCFSQAALWKCVLNRIWWHLNGRAVRYDTLTHGLSLLRSARCFLSINHWNIWHSWLSLLSMEL